MSMWSSITRAIDFAFAGGGSHQPVRQHDHGTVVARSTDDQGARPPGHAPPPGAEERAHMESQGYHWVDDPGYWALNDHVGPDPSEGPGPGVETHDHSDTNPSNWTIEEWKAAFKRDPEKYTRLFQDLATTPDGLSKDVQDHKAEMNNLVATVVQDFNRDMTLLKSLIDANHETQKSLAQFRV